MASQVQRNQLGAHSILALEEFFARGYLQIQIKSRESRESSDAPEMSLLPGGGAARGERRVCGAERGGEAGGRDSSVSGWRRSRRNRANGRSACRSRPTRGYWPGQPEEFPAKSGGDVIIFVYFHSNALNAFDSLQLFR